jgi:hypothetical protein
VSVHIWSATGRWRVRQFLSPRVGLAGQPQLRYAVINPDGRHMGSSTSWGVAQEAAVEMARSIEHESATTRTD